MNKLSICLLEMAVCRAIEAMEARDALTKSMRKNRRAKIKEANFLKAMG
jgi:hypothetical protein